MSAPTVYLRAHQVYARYGGCSHMWIVRRAKNAGFPAPIYFGRRRFWRVADLDAWDAEQIERSITRAPPRHKRAPGQAVQS